MINAKISVLFRELANCYDEMCLLRLQINQKRTFFRTEKGKPSSDEERLNKNIHNLEKQLRISVGSSRSNYPDAATD